MSEFNLAFDDVLNHEGGFVEHKMDSGLATKFGISLRFLKLLPAIAGDVNGDGHVDKLDILSLNQDDARAFYQRYFWTHYRLGEIHNQRVATKMFNFFVNMRGVTAGLVLQRAANDLGANILEDGIVGRRTLSVVNNIDPGELLVCIKWRAWEVYKAIVKSDPSQVVFINGWRHRAFFESL